MRQKRSILAIAVFIALSGSLWSAPRYDRPPPAAHKTAGSQSSVTDGTIGINKIFSYVTNLGTFARDNVGTLNLSGGGGMVFPFAGLDNIANGQANKTCIFASGIWVGGIDATNGDTLMIISEFSEECVPGPMAGGTFQPDVPAFRIYTLYSDSLASNPNQDYLNWPVSQGAPVDAMGNPQITGDQMLWCVFNDADFASHGNDAGGTLPMGIEIQFSVFGFNREDPLGNIIFLRYKLMNKGGKNLDSMYVSLWSDPDLGGFADDLVGSDTLLSLGYVYNANNNDGVYGTNPPAVGYDFFQGPLQFTGSLADTAIMWGQFIPMNVNLPLVSFNKYINGTDPDLPSESYAYQNGLDGKTGLPLLDPNTNQPTKFFGNGDPVTNSGFLDNNPADRRFMLNTGPISFAPGDSTEIIAAIVVGQGVDRLTSISAMKFFDKFAQTAYEKFFNLPKPPAAPVVTVREFENEVVLIWGTDSEDNPGDFPFEGYTIYQGESPAGPWKRLKTFDENNGIASIFDDQFDINQGVVLNVPVQFGVDGGIQHQISLTNDAIGGGRLNNVTNYFFRIEAYSFDPAETPKVLTASTVVTAIPQAPVAGTNYPQTYGDVLTATHASGTSDGAVTPLVVDASALTGNTYRVIFTDSIESGSNVTRWSLFNATTGDTLLLRQLNQSGADTGYSIIDGLLMRVSGPPLQGKSFSYAPSSPLNISPVVQADEPGYAGNERWLSGASGSDGELLFGGIYLAPNFVGTTVPAAGFKTVEVRFRPMVSYTDLTGDGRYTNGESYVVDDPVQTQSAFMYSGFADANYQGFNPVPFTVWDVTNPATPRQLNVVVRDRDGNGQWDFHEDLTTTDPNAALLPNGGDLRFNYVWLLDSDYDPTGLLYGDGTGGTIGFMTAFQDALWTMWLGDRGSGRGLLGEESILTLVPNIVNSPADTFTFTSPAPVVASSVTTAALENVKAVPNPYYLFSSYEPDQFLRKLLFTNLPTVCTIRIFNLSGELVRTLEKNSTASFMPWDVQTKNRLPVGSGIYVYLVTTPDGSEKIGKMAIFTEAEQLSNF